jgi:hypothetical protein
MNVDLQEGYRLYNERKFKEAYDILFDAALYGNNGEAQYYLGMMYFYGDGVNEDLEAAKKWWQKAVRNGQVDAANRLSELSTSTKNMF